MSLFASSNTTLTILSVYLFITLTATSCPSTTDPLFVKCWANSFEEEGQDNIRIYRPCATHTFMAARYRSTFTLKETGEAEYSVLAPNDAHTTAQGVWSYDAKTKKLIFREKNGSIVMDYEVVEIEE